MLLQAIKYQAASANSPNSLEILDQLALPHRQIYLPIINCEQAWDAIKTMKVRGAPAIAIVAALALAVELCPFHTITNPIALHANDVLGHQTFIIEKLDYLETSRPTAVNLSDAAAKLRSIVNHAAAGPDATGLSVARRYITAAEKMLEDDVKDNEAIGANGAEWILRRAHRGQKVCVLTHCNTGYDQIPHLSVLHSAAFSFSLPSSYL